MTQAEISCRELVDFIADYLDGALSAEQLAVFERHLAICRSCRAYLRSYETTIRLSKAMGRYDDSTLDAAPEDLVQAILKARRR